MPITDLLMYGMVAVMILLMVRSNRKRKQQAEELQNQLVPGAKVTLHAGIVGTVVSVDDAHFIMETAGSKLEVNKFAIRSVSLWNEPVLDAVEQPVAEEELPPVPVKKTTRKPAAKKAADSAE